MVKAEEMPKGQVIDAWTAVATQLEWVAEDTGLGGGGAHKNSTQTEVY